MALTTSKRRAAAFAGPMVVIVLALAPMVLTPFSLFQLATVVIWAVAILGVNLVTGYSGQITLATSGFVGLGAYTTAILGARGGAPGLVSLAVTALAGFFIGLLVAWPASRLRGIQLLMITAVVAVAFAPIVKRFPELTGGQPGMAVVIPPPPAGLAIRTDVWIFWVNLAIAVVLAYLVARLTRGSIGRSLIALKEIDTAAATLGVNPAAYRVVVFAIGSMVMSVSGAMYVWTYGFVAPDAFPLTLSITLLAAAVIGGLVSGWGALAGGAVMTLTPYLLGGVNAASTGLLFGVCLILLVFVMPGGAAGALHAFHLRLMATLGRRAS